MIRPAEVEALIAALGREISALRAEVGALRGENEALRAENGALRAENTEFRRRLDQDSTTSSKPPSSDGLRKKPRLAASLRGRSGKASGGQLGHKGDTLRRMATPDRIVRHEAQACRHCGAGLTASMQSGVETRQVFDLPERLIEVTEHQGAIYACACCGRVTRAAFPERVISPAQYGERIRAAAVYLNVQQLLPEDRTAQALQDLFGAPLACAASVTAWARDKAQNLEPVYRAIGARAGEAKVRHLDETGFRIAGSLQWLHTVSSQRHTVYRVGKARGDVPEGLKGGVVVHDHFRPYNALAGVDHAFCNAHHLRELKALIEIDKEPWAQEMRDVLLDAARAVRRAKETGASALEPERVKAFVDRYWQALKAGLAFHRSLPAFDLSQKSRKRKKQRPGHNLLIRFKTFKDETLRFLVDFDVPFTNNLAEQDLRMTKVKMKISGCFRTFNGADLFVRLRSIVSTARKHALNILQSLTADPNKLLATLSP
jgi:transposase